MKEETSQAETRKVEKHARIESDFQFIERRLDKQEKEENRKVQSERKNGDKMRGAPS
jgi:hypothetical protein